MKTTTINLLSILPTLVFAVFARASATNLHFENSAFPLAMFTVPLNAEPSLGDTAKITWTETQIVFATVEPGIDPNSTDPLYGQVRFAHSIDTFFGVGPAGTRFIKTKITVIQLSKFVPAWDDMLIITGSASVVINDASAPNTMAQLRAGTASASVFWMAPTLTYVERDAVATVGGNETFVAITVENHITRDDAAFWVAADVEAAPATFVVEKSRHQPRSKSE